MFSKVLDFIQKKNKDVNDLVARIERENKWSAKIRQAIDRRDKEIAELRHRVQELEPAPEPAPKMATGWYFVWDDERPECPATEYWNGSMWCASGGTCPLDHWTHYELFKAVADNKERG